MKYEVIFYIFDKPMKVIVEADNKQEATKNALELIKKRVLIVSSEPIEWTDDTILNFFKGFKK